MRGDLETATPLHDSRWAALVCTVMNLHQYLSYRVGLRGNDSVLIPVIPRLDRGIQLAGAKVPLDPAVKPRDDRGVSGMTGELAG